jgi:hypothetical protein
MIHLVTRSFLLFVLTAVFASVGCGPKGFIKGDYDDPERQNLINGQRLTCSRLLRI